MPLIQRKTRQNQINIDDTQRNVLGNNFFKRQSIFSPDRNISIPRASNKWFVSFEKRRKKRRRKK